MSSLSPMARSHKGPSKKRRESDQASSMIQREHDAWVIRSPFEVSIKKQDLYGCKIYLEKNIQNSLSKKEDLLAPIN